ncbi:type I restriction-modification system [Klebsiella pneumoniae]|uniref:Type I restriction-modification system n=1 Tax=Klebsiella pneumoniae TaxID=573 RepID=A0A378B8E7_KLEPN|nr:type I restriction-modification system [Klebsiella pneumoniae]
MPVGRYDCIVVDEAHRGYILDKEQTEGELQFRSQLDYVSAYRRILDHFDAVKIALPPRQRCTRSIFSASRFTATPTVRR